MFQNLQYDAIVFSKSIWLELQLNFAALTVPHQFLKDFPFNPVVQTKVCQTRTAVGVTTGAKKAMASIIDLNMYTTLLFGERVKVTRAANLAKGPSATRV